MRKSMLTYETLDRFEALVDISTLTSEQIADIEHCAFAANMGAEDKQAAWNWFAHLMESRGIMLPMFCHVLPCAPALTHLTRAGRQPAETPAWASWEAKAHRRPGNAFPE